MSESKKQAVYAAMENLKQSPLYPAIKIVSSPEPYDEMCERLGIKFEDVDTMAKMLEAIKLLRGVRLDYTDLGKAFLVGFLTAKEMEKDGS